MEDDTKGLIRQLGKISIIGIEMVVSTFVGLAIGVFLDRKFETAPVFTIVFLIVGIIAGYRNVFREIKKLDGGKPR